MTDVLDQIKGDYKPNIRNIKTQLIERFGDIITITKVGSGRGHHTLLSFMIAGNNTLHNNWYREKRSDTRSTEERLRVVKSATERILQDICSTPYDTKEYPSSDDFLQNVDSDVPDSLKPLLVTIILKNKRQSLICEKRNVFQ